MLYFYTGTDIDTARAAARAAAGETAMRITDAHSIDDARTALLGGGMFMGPQTIIFDRVFGHDEMKELLFTSLSYMKIAPDFFYIVSEKLDAATQKILEKNADETKKFDLARSAKASSDIFAIANALKKGDKKSLWVGLQRELMNGAAPEAIHGILFWAAKDMFLKSREGSGEHARAKKLVASLAELPHTSRRRGEELSYSLERFLLS
jgi:hypothetical protein